MLSYPELVSLERSMRGERVLSVYVDGTAADPAIQRTWRVQLDHAVEDLRRWLADESHEEREQFSACVRTLESELGAFDGGVRAPGWTAFITPDGVRHAGPVPVSMPTMAAWSTGASVAPYIRALKQNRPVIVAVMDERKATVYRYRVGKLDRTDTLHARKVEEPEVHMGRTPKPGFHVGTRGPTGHDVVQRARREAMNRMLAELAERVTALAGADGWILLGGIPRVVAHAANTLAPLAARLLPLKSLDVHATPAEIAEAAKVGGSALRDRWDAAQVDEIIEQAEAGLLGVLGPVATDRALDLSCVSALFVSPHYLADHGAEAEHAVRRAFDQGAMVERVSHAAAARLDAHGGLAARLRFRPPASDGATPMEMAERRA